MSAMMGMDSLPSLSGPFVVVKDQDLNLAR